MEKRQNLGNAQVQQKRWYDQHARDCELRVGENVLVLLPTSTSKLLAKWQGSYSVLWKLGAVPSEVNIFDRAKRKRVFNINMLWKWHPPTETNVWIVRDPDTTQEDMILWLEDDDTTATTISKDPSKDQHQQLSDLLRCSTEHSRQNSSD